MVMENESIEKLPILRITQQGKSEIEDVVVREHSLTIVLNNKELVTLLCSPGKLEYLAAGFLLSQGLINSRDDIREIVIDDNSIARVETNLPVEIPASAVVASSGARGVVSLSVRKISAKYQVELSPSRIFSLVEDFVQHSKLFKNTGGVHSAALCDLRGILVFSEDIGRHNAIDKVFGECLLKYITTDNCIVITSGRVSSEILFKVAKRDVPVLISKSAPTDMGVRLADESGVTLIGFVRGEKMNVYTHSWRVMADVG